MPGRYHSTVSWQEAVNEKGATENVLTSALIVLGVATALIFIGLKILPRFKIRTLSKEFIRKAFFGCCALMILAGFVAGNPIIAGPPAILLVCGLIASAFKLPEPDETGLYSFTTPVSTGKGYLLYKGRDLGFSDPEMETVLNKYLPYYTALNSSRQQVFLKRLGKFISRKNFVIHDSSGFKEMPILIGASAIQLSFGLSKYLLPVFSEIHIYPEEFVNYHQSFRVVIGNVSDNRINISWKHFLNGFKYPDGVNVGLHEMAHAYHYQNFAAQADKDDGFIENYKAFEDYSKTALLYQLSNLSSLYTLYGLSNEQEFWAESIELFFEKPAELQALDNSLFTIISATLHQTIIAD